MTPFVIANEGPLDEPLRALRVLAGASVGAVLLLLDERGTSIVVQAPAEISLQLADFLRYVAAHIEDPPSTATQ